MSLAWWAVLVAALIPVLLAGLAKRGGGYDNARPREFATGLTGFRQRAYAAHLNGFEAFPLFSAAVAASAINGVPRGTADSLALAFVAARLAYTAAYLADAATLRSALWTLAFGCSILLLTAPVWA